VDWAAPIRSKCRGNVAATEGNLSRPEAETKAAEAPDLNQKQQKPPSDPLGREIKIRQRAKISQRAASLENRAAVVVTSEWSRRFAKQEQNPDGSFACQIFTILRIVLANPKID